MFTNIVSNWNLESGKSEENDEREKLSVDLFDEPTTYLYAPCGLLVLSLLTINRQHDINRSVIHKRVEICRVNAAANT